MNFGKYASAYAINSRFGKLVLPAAFAVAVFQTGCMESSSGGAQGETQSPPTALRVTSANPNCKLETHLIILDEDAIRNASHCGCSLAHKGEKNGDQNWVTDDDDGMNAENDEAASRDLRVDDSQDRSRGNGNHKAWNDIPAKSAANCRNDRDNQPDRVTICHIPPGNHDNGHTITVGASAVKAHLAHGDNLAACI
ncbi:MAG: hypothetical protein ABI036_08710, partial [Fibrobacteria bacterium]